MHNAQFTIYSVTGDAVSTVAIGRLTLTTRVMDCFSRRGVTEPSTNVNGPADVRDSTRIDADDDDDSMMTSSAVATSGLNGRRTAVESYRPTFGSQTTSPSVHAGW